MSSQRWFRIGSYGLLALAVIHFISNRNGLPIVVNDAAGRELLDLMTRYEINFFGWNKTLAQTIDGFILTWGVMLLVIGSVNLMIANRDVDMPPPLGIRLANAAAWILCLIGALIFWSWPQILLFAGISGAFVMSVFEGAPKLRTAHKPGARPVPKVAVIGAGCAGLTAAYILQKRGYKVTVFEKADRVGGKCFTQNYEGFAIDIGAHEMLAGYKDVMRIADEVGAKSHGDQDVLVYDRYENQYLDVMAANLVGGYSNLAVGWAALRYTWLLLTRYRKISKPGTGLANAPGELLQPVGTWLKEMKLEPLEEIILFVMKVQGYGRLDEVPALYFVKFQGFGNWTSNVLHTIGIVKAWPRVFTNGFEDLWKRVSYRLEDVRLNTEVTSVTRRLRADADMIGIEISTKDRPEPEQFDKLILACPLDLPSLDALNIDLDEGERDVFSKVKYHTMVTTACSVQGIPTGVVGTIPLPPLLDYTGYIKVYPDCDVTVFFTLAPEPDPKLEPIFQRICDIVETLPATEVHPPRVLENHEQKAWNYFPHTDLTELAAGYFDKVQSLQGHRHTYYTGSLLEMETVGNTVANATHLARTQFPPVQ